MQVVIWTRTFSEKPLEHVQSPKFCSFTSCLITKENKPAAQQEVLVVSGMNHELFWFQNAFWSFFHVIQISTHYNNPNYKNVRNSKVLG